MPVDHDLDELKRQAALARLEARIEAAKLREAKAEEARRRIENGN